MSAVPTPKINTLLNDKKQEKLFFFMTIFYQIQMVWGFDYGFFYFKSAKANFVLKIMSLFIYILFITIFFWYYHYPVNEHHIWLDLFMVKHLLFILFLVSLNSKSTLRSFHYDVQAIDSKVGFDTATFHLESKILLSGFLCFFFRIFVMISYWLIAGYNGIPLYFAVIFICSLSNIDTLLASYAFIFYSVYCRLKKLSEIVKQSNKEFIPYIFTYKLYVDFVVKYKRAFDPLQVIALCTTVPEVMITIFVSIVRKSDRPLSVMIWTYNLEYLMVVEAFAITLAPGIFAGMLNSQTERLKLLLHDKLWDKKDDINVAREIERFIRYVEARPCRFRVWKVIPLDVDLFGMMLSFCVTYLIVIMQFVYKSAS